VVASRVSDDKLERETGVHTEGCLFILNLVSFLEWPNEWDKQWLKI
jgi:hypothetical protein